MIYLYNLFLYKPLLNGLVFLYQTIAFEDLGIAIILLTILIRLVLFPIFQKGAKHQRIIQKLQPELKKIETQHKQDAKKKTAAMLSLYKEHQVNPFAGFFLLLVQIPILIALYRIFFQIYSPDVFVDLYSFLSVPASLNNTFLGLINLKNPSILIVLLAAAAQYWQTKLSLVPSVPGQPATPAEKMGRQMAVLGPIITVFIFFRLPAAVSLYWLISSLFSIGQQIIINRQLDGKFETIRPKSS